MAEGGSELPSPPTRLPVPLRPPQEYLGLPDFTGSGEDGSSLLSPQEQWDVCVGHLLLALHQGEGGGRGAVYGGGHLLRCTG